MIYDFLINLKIIGFVLNIEKLQQDIKFLNLINKILIDH